MKKNLSLSIIGILLPILIIFFFPSTKMGTNMNLWWYDFLYYLRGEKSPPKEIIVVAIDEPSFQEIGLQWPWPRSLHAQLIDNLKKDGAKSITFDVLFVEHSKYQVTMKFLQNLLKMLEMLFLEQISHK